MTPTREAVPFVPDESMTRLLRERDNLFLLHEALADVDRAPTLQARLRIFVEAIQRIGFGRVVMTVRDTEFNPVEIVTGGLSPSEEHSLRTASASGAVWRRRLAEMERFRVSQSYYLEAADAWVAAEFGDALPSRAEADHRGAWSPRDFLFLPLRDPRGEIIATLVADDPTDRSRPSLARIRTVELFAQQVASLLERVRLVELAEHRAEQLQRLQRAGNALAGSLREMDIARELARQVELLVPCDGVTIVMRAPDGTFTPAARRAQGIETVVQPSDRCHELCEAVTAVVGPVHFEPSRPSGSALLGVPALSGDVVVAVIAVWRVRPAFGPADDEVLLTVGAHAATALSNARLYAASEKDRRQGEALADIASAVSASLRLDQVMQLSLRHAVALLHANGASLTLLRDAHLIVVAAVGDGERTLGMRLPLDASLSGVSLRDGRAIISNESASDPGAYGPTRRAAGVERAVMVPLIGSTGPHGVLTVINREAPFDDADAQVLQRLGDHVATAIANARLFEEHSALAERYRSVVETTADAIVITNRERRIVFTNGAAERLFASEAGAIGELVQRFVPDEERANIAAHEDAALAGTPQRYRTVLVRGDGERRLVSISTSPMRVGADAIGIVASLRDYTDEHRARDAAAHSEARYTRLVESASDGIFTVDAAGRITSANRSLERSVGHARDALIGRPFTDLVDARDTDIAAQLLTDSLGGKRVRGEVRYAAPHGDVRNASVMTTPIVDDGVLSGVLGVVRDVTDEKRLTEQLVQQEKLAAVGQLVSGVAHELNNPLAGVVAFSQLLLASPVADADHRPAIETIYHQAKRAARIVANLLTFARQHQPERTDTDLNQVLLDTLDLRRYGLRVGQIDVVLRLDPLLPSTWADPFQLQQVALNLLGNAEQALEDWHGERRIELATECRGSMLVLRVSDTGPGIAPEHLTRIFNPFFTTKPVGKGTGLGLSISDGIVREHGGRIRVESRVDHGATFIVELPRATALPAAPAPERAPAVVAAGCRRVLVVDDEPAIRAVIAKYLRSLGHAVDIFGSAREVLERITTHSYDVLVLDLRMPEMSGDTLFAELQSRAPELARRVVFLTGDTQSEAARRFLDGTGRPIVSKPFVLDELAAIILAEAAA